VSKSNPELPCFNSSVIEETSSIFQPVTVVPVPIQSVPQDKEAVIVELAPKNILTMTECGVSQSPPSEVQDVVMSEPEGHKDNHGDVPKSGQFLPVEGGYIFVGDGAPGNINAFIDFSLYCVVSGTEQKNSLSLFHGCRKRRLKD
jgi:hypothetical protein